MINEPVKPDRSSRIVELDGLRGAAISLVLIYHYFVITGPAFLSSGLLKPLGATWSGVDLFFVLSGFLIGGILIDNRLATNYFKVFYVRRICRIFPLYFLWLAIFIVIVVALDGRALTPASNWLWGKPIPLWSYATFTQNFAFARSNNFGPDWLSVSWSLAIEEQFYLVLPLIVRITPPRRLPYLLVCLIILAPVFRIFIAPHFYGRFGPYLLMPARADALLLGVLCAYLIRQEKFRDYLARFGAVLNAVFVVLVVATVALTFNRTEIYAPVMTSYGFSAFALLYACLLLIVVTQKGSFMAKVTRNRGLRHMGLLAYGVYIIQEGVSGVVFAVLLGKTQTPGVHSVSELLVALVALCCTLLLAQISWDLYEKRFVALGHRTRYHNPYSEPALQVAASEPVLRS